MVSCAGFIGHRWAWNGCGGLGVGVVDLRWVWWVWDGCDGLGMGVENLWWVWWVLGRYGGTRWVCHVCMVGLKLVWWAV